MPNFVKISCQIMKISIEELEFDLVICPVANLYTILRV